MVYKRNQYNFSVVLFSPEIPGNTGSVGRTCVSLDIPLILIKPLGFDINEKAVRRAGLDYWKHLDLRVFENWEQYLEKENPKSLMFFENDTGKTFFEADYPSNVHLVFGSETKGISIEIRSRYEGQFYELPMFSDKIRSLNLSNVATTVAYQCLGHQLGAICPM